MTGILSGIGTELIVAALIAAAGIAWKGRHQIIGAAGARSTMRRMGRSGVREAFFARAQYRTAAYTPLRDIIDYLDTAKLRVRYIGLWMAQASEQHRLDEAVRSLLNRGCEVHFVMLDPRMRAEELAAAAAVLGAGEGEVRDRSRIALEKLIDLRESLGPNLRNRLNLSVHSHPLLMSTIEFDWDTEDHRCWLDIKLRSRGRADSLSMEIVRGSDDLLGRVMAAMEEPVKTARPVADRQEG